jgi:methionyl-tRNA formyltransferase
VHWAIIKGETETGASLHYMVEKPDAGALVDQQSVPIDLDDDALAVSMKVADAAQRVLKRSLPKLIAGSAAATPLDLKRGSYFGRRRPEDGRIDWQAGAKAVHDLVRAVAPPFPGAFTEVGSERIQIFKTQIQSGGPKIAAEAPCLYRADEAWYADCFDGRLKILQLAVNGETVTQNSVPAILTRLPLALSRP